MHCTQLLPNQPLHALRGIVPRRTLASGSLTCAAKTFALARLQVCFFAHSPRELRVPPNVLQQLGGATSRPRAPRGAGPSPPVARASTPGGSHARRPPLQYGRYAPAPQWPVGAAPLAAGFSDGSSGRAGAWTDHLQAQQHQAGPAAWVQGGAMHEASLGMGNGGSMRPNAAALDTRLYLDHTAAAAASLMAAPPQGGAPSPQNAAAVAGATVYYSHGPEAAAALPHGGWQGQAQQPVPFAWLPAATLLDAGCGSGNGAGSWEGAEGGGGGGIGVSGGPASGSGAIDIAGGSGGGPCNGWGSGIGGGVGGGGGANGAQGRLVGVGAAGGCGPQGSWDGGACSEEMLQCGPCLPLWQVPAPPGLGAAGGGLGWDPHLASLPGALLDKDAITAALLQLQLQLCASSEPYVSPPLSVSPPGGPLAPLAGGLTNYEAAAGMGGSTHAPSLPQLPAPRSAAESTRASEPGDHIARAAGRSAP